MLIKVTEKHIAHGQRSTCDSCPIALAMKEQLQADYVYAGITGLIYMKGDELYESRTDTSARVFMNSFDLNPMFRPTVIEPFEFEADFAVMIIHRDFWSQKLKKVY